MSHVYKMYMKKHCLEVHICNQAFTYAIICTTPSVGRLVTQKILLSTLMAEPASKDMCAMCT